MSKKATATGFTCDKILKSVLADALLIEQLLRRCVCAPGHEDIFDYTTLQQLPTEQIDASIRKYFYNDLVWKIHYRNASLRPTYVVVMLELQSTPSYSMVLRMLNYVVQFYLAWVHNRKGAGTYPLPHIIPLVLYSGLAAWKGPQSIQELLPENPMGAWEETSGLQFKFKLLDFAHLDWRSSEDSLLGYFIGCLQAYSEINKRPHWRDIKSLLHKLDRDAACDSWAQLYAMMVSRCGEVESMSTDIAERVYPKVTTMDVEEIDAYLDSLEANGEIVPYGGRMRVKGQAEGRAEGRVEGRAEGRAEGRVEGRAEGRVEGRAEGRVEGRVEGKADAIASFILLRYAECPQDVVDMVRHSQDQEFLNRATTAVATENTLGGFLQNLGL